MKFFLICVFACVTLAGCAGGEKPDARVVVHETKVVIPVSCVPNVSPRPIYADSDEELKALPNLSTRVKTLKAAREMRIPYETELEAVINACK